MGRFPPKFVIEVGMTASFGNKNRVPFRKRGGRPPSIDKSCTPPGCEGYCMHKYVITKECSMFVQHRCCSRYTQGPQSDPKSG